MMLATAVLPFVLQFADVAMRGGKAFVCTDPATGTTTMALSDVRKAKATEAPGVWLVTFSGNRREAVQVNPAHTCKVVK